MCLPNFMKFHHCLFKILKNQNVADGGTNKRTNGWKDGQHENSILPHKQSLRWGGIIITQYYMAKKPPTLNIIHREYLAVFP